MILKTRIIGILILTLFCNSCSSNLDFDQIDDLVLKPVYVANLTYFDLQANQFVDNGSGNNMVFDDQYFDVFRTKFFNENLYRADFDFAINNTVARGFQIELILLDKENQPLDAIHFIIPAYTGVSNIVTQSEIFENERVDILLNTFKIRFAITIDPGTPLTAATQGSLKLQSKGTVYLVVE